MRSARARLAHSMHFPHFGFGARCARLAACSPCTACILATAGVHWQSGAQWSWRGASLVAASSWVAKRARPHVQGVQCFVACGIRALQATARATKARVRVLSRQRHRRSAQVRREYQCRTAHQRHCRPGVCGHAIPAFVAGVHVACASCAFRPRARLERFIVPRSSSHSGITHSAYAQLHSALPIRIACANARRSRACACACACSGAR